MLENIEKGSHIIVVGSGATIKENKDKILRYIHETGAKTIGINCMTELCVPDYHLWTNKQRYRDLGHCIDIKSKFIFGEGLSEKLIRKHYNGEYIKLHYIDEDGVKVTYKNGIIYGHFRTAGTLSIMVAHVMGANKIDIVGMDGYTLYGQKELKKGKKSHHCYGQGYTDDASWEKCIQKDKLVNKALHDIHDYGVIFNILTPTKFSDFHHAIY